MATEFMVRPAKSVVYVATIRPSATPPAAHSVEAGDDVKLYAGKIEVFVRVAELRADGSYRGRIIGANGHGQPVGAELAAGADTVFLEKHIFTCSKHR